MILLPEEKETPRDGEMYDQGAGYGRDGDRNGNGARRYRDSGHSIFRRNGGRRLGKGRQSYDVDVDDDSIYSKFHASGTGSYSAASLTHDGRISVLLDLKKNFPDLPPDYALEVEEPGVDHMDWNKCPRLNIVIMIVGSRGDVQPYVALAQRLRRDKHRVRLASHGTFRSFVEDAGIEFYDIGGDPAFLMSYMVKNPGLMPGIDSLRNGDIPKNRGMVAAMMNACWLACHGRDQRTGLRFAADAIISNPPTFAHIHCAEALGIPLLMTFTMPWSPTTLFPHPLVNIKQSNAKNGLTNYMSYALTENLTWQGLGDLVNKLRTKALGLPALSVRTGPGLLDKYKVPWTYCMSPGLVPKPNDWKSHIDVVGFYSLDLATNYTPARELVQFLQAGETPIYIGFGSIVVEDSAAMTELIFAATAKAGVRALVSAGWGGLGGVDVPSHIFILGNIPHDWLFSNGRVKAVVHHGGAGTTAAGLSKGLPTVVVPFFGDQGFWGSMIYKAGAGPAPIPHKKLGVDNLCEAILVALSMDCQIAAEKMAAQIRDDNGVEKGVESFYRHLPLMNMRCDLDPSRVAVWWSTEHCLKLSALAAQVLHDATELNLSDLDAHRPREYTSRKHTTHHDPVNGGSSDVFWSVTENHENVSAVFSPSNRVLRSAAAIPHGVVNAVFSVNKSVWNAPALYGAHVRPVGEVTGFASGLKEAGKSLFLGSYDAVANVFVEPYQGAREEGVQGFFKGAGKGIIGFAVRPIAGFVGVIAHPVQGAWKTFHPSPTTAPHSGNLQRQTRFFDGREDFKNSSPRERAHILRRFRELKPETLRRQTRYSQMVMHAVQQHGIPEEEEENESDAGTETAVDGMSVGSDESDATSRPTKSPKYGASESKYWKGKHSPSAKEDGDAPPQYSAMESTPSPHAGPWSPGTPEHTDFPFPVPSTGPSTLSKQPPSSSGSKRHTAPPPFPSDSPSPPPKEKDPATFYHGTRDPRPPRAVQLSWNKTDSSGHAGPTDSNGQALPGSDEEFDREMQLAMKLSLREHHGADEHRLP